MLAPSLLPLLALALALTASSSASPAPAAAPAPANLIARGETVAIVTTFAAASCRDPARRQYIVDRDSPSTGHVVANTCFSETAYGSIAVDFVGARCQFSKHFSGTCEDAGYDIVTPLQRRPEVSLRRGRSCRVLDR
ncbi:hypothetical protein BKA61DRAFT_567041 [Leptodontidium sp. MPI-SDFR-AT-0119]|nr:hypothetical protein BKA61DRAFT_567041 [Leptodontidium sp. MPI-SDFR-AT-0119]